MRWFVDTILFDIDGTLVDSTNAVEHSWVTWADAHGLDSSMILAVAHGRRSIDTIADFHPREGREAAIAEMEALEFATADQATALPGSDELLSSIPDGRWAVVTSGGRALMAERLKHAGLPVPWAFVAAEDVSAGKPDPEGYRKGAALLGFDPHDCLVIEDAPAGIRAGIASGATVLGISSTHRPDDLREAHAVIESLAACRVAVDAGGRLAITVPAGSGAPRRR